MVFCLKKVISYIFDFDSLIASAAEFEQKRIRILTFFQTYKDVGMNQSYYCCNCLIDTC